MVRRYIARSVTEIRMPAHSTNINDGSDYGSEVEDDLVNELLSRAESQPLNDATLIDDTTEVVVGKIVPNVAILPDVISSAFPDDGFASVEDNGQVLSLGEPVLQSQPFLSIRCPSSSSSPPPRSVREDSCRPQPDSRDDSDQGDRSPIERFRTRPKKPLSVTDLVSPAWCELQYWYNLTRYGKVRATPAMKQGSNVHRALEDEVHVRVTVDVTTKEDRFALRLWNIITGMRTLRQTGMTRELEVWGLVDGEIVNGVIDQVSLECPDAEQESAICSTGANRSTNKKQLEQRVTSTNHAQTSLSTFGFGSSKSGRASMYLTDVKTRQSKKVPSGDGGQLRPVYMQLMLYHFLLSSMIKEVVPAEKLLGRYKLDADTVLSDSFIAQMCEMQDVASSQSSASDRSPTRDNGPVHEVIEHNTLGRLWAHMINEFANHDITKLTISPFLTAEYRAASDGALMGRHHFAFDENELNSYVADKMQWWKGGRTAKGVEIEEAYKCQICEFASKCSWRATKLEETIERARARRTVKTKYPND